MSETQPRQDAREFNADDARAIALRIIEAGEGPDAHFSEAAADTLAAIIMWEALKLGDRSS